MSTPPPPAPQRVMATLVLASLGAFLASLDVVVVSTALPTLQSNLRASLSELEWTVNGYNLAFSCLMLTGAALGDRFGRRNMYVVGVAVFTLSSIACALSDSSGSLITARVVQGAGAAVLLPLTLTLISDAFPVEKRGMAIGIWGGITGLGVAAGPVLGGLIIQGIGWQWIFWINVPVGAVVLVLTPALLKDNRGSRPQLDLIGLVLVAASLFALVWAPVRAPSIGWDGGEVIGALVVGAVLMVAFFAWQRRARHPMLPLEYFGLRGFSTANGVIFFVFFSLIGSLFMIAQMFQAGLGYDPLEAGLRILVWTAMPMVVAPAAGVLSDKIGNKPFMVAGPLLQAAGLAWLGSVAKSDVSYSTLVAPLVVAGVGIGMVFPTVANAVVAAVPVHDSGVAAGTNNTLREAGGVFGVAVLSAVFAGHGGYASPADFMDGFKAAEIVAAVVVVAGALVAVFAPGKKQVHASSPSAGPPSRRTPQAEQV